MNQNITFFCFKAKENNTKKATALKETVLQLFKWIVISLARG
ncbi:unnamed protein product [Fructobacillus tropaeoli]|nr:unnamed protein product [Fructobacillus tropaeoli]